ncbi:MAG: spore maturation protein [Clostridia bacterium]|nr:spore maturation protein [Clostridia bacterium]
MMMWVFGGMIAVGLGFYIAGGMGAEALAALLNGAEQAVELTVSLAGTYLLWTGLMNIASEAGLIKKLANAMKKPLGLLMPDAGDAMGPITLNLAANFFGLGNAATPFGVAAVKRLSRGDGVATDDMCMFLALNSSAIELMPTTVIAVRTACGSKTPYDIILPTFAASVVSAAAAIICCKALEGIGGRASKRRGIKR